MAFPWVTLIMWVLSFFLSKTKGMKTGKAALVATGAAAATYVVADPANEKNLLGIGSKSTAEAAPTATAGGDVEHLNGASTHEGDSNELPNPEKEKAERTKKEENFDSTSADVLKTAINTAGGVVSAVVSETGSVVKDLGATGTVGLVTGVKASGKLADAAGDVAGAVGTTTKSLGNTLSDPKTQKYLLLGGAGLLALLLLK